MSRRPFSAVPPLLAALFAAAAPAAAQIPEPSPSPNTDRLSLEVEAVLRARSSLELGSGARANGMGGAFLARADDATAASWNPAGLSYLRRPELSLVGARGNFSSREVRPGDVEITETGSGRAMDFAAATYPLGNWGAAQVSYQRVITFTGDGVEETPDTVRTAEAKGGFDVIAVGSGVSLGNLRIGGTVNRWFNGYTQTLIREPIFGRTRGRVDQVSHYDLTGWNVNLGLIWEPFESLNLGAVGKTPFTADVRLRRERTDVSPSGTAFTTNSAERDNVELDLPGALGFGASWRPRSQITLSADYTRTFWSQARIRNFFTLAPTEEGSAALPPEQTGDFHASLPYPTFTAPANDTEQVRVGVEYVIVSDRYRWPIRVGYFSDRQTFPAADGRPPRFNGATVGMGFGVGPLLMDVAFVYERGDWVETNDFDQSLRTRRVLVSLIYRDLVRR